MSLISQKKYLIVNPIQKYSLFLSKIKFQALKNRKIYWGGHLILLWWMFVKHPLIPINEDYKWRLLSDILSLFDLRSTKQILTKYEILPLEKSIPALKIVRVSMYFCLEISYVVSELEDKKKLRKFTGIKSVPS